MYALFSYAYLCVGEENICVAANGATIFQCVASAAHFLFFEEKHMKKLFSLLVTAALLLGCLSILSSCDDLSEGSDAAATQLQGEKGADGKDGKDGQDGKDGTDGSTPYVGENGNWWADGKDLGVPVYPTSDGTEGFDFYPLPDVPRTLSF